MAKNGTNGKRLNLAIAGLVVTVLVISASALTSYVNTRHETGDAAKAIDTLKKDGCDPAVKGREDVSVIKVQLQGIQKDLSSVQVQQTALQVQQTAVSQKQDVQHAEVMDALRERDP